MSMFKFFATKILKLILLALLVLSFLVLGNLYTYRRLTSEKPIAQLTFTPISSQVFDATLQLGDFCEENIYRIYGDEWRIDSQFLKWNSWATLFGLNSMYRIDRLSGRYANIEDENTKTNSAHELSTSSTLDLSKLAEQYNNKFPPVDTVYGSSAYEKMQENILFTVFVTQSGILIRENFSATIPEKINCTPGKSIWKDTIVKLDQNLAKLVHSFK